MLWCCWLGGRKGIRPVQQEWWGAGVVVCLERGADLQLMPLPLTVSCFSEIQTGFTFLVPAHTGNPGQRAVKRVCVCVCGITLQLQSDVLSLFMNDYEWLAFRSVLGPVERQKYHRTFFWYPTIGFKGVSFVPLGICEIRVIRWVIFSD